MRYQTPPQRVKGQLIGTGAEALALGEAALRLGTIAEAIGALERRDTLSPSNRLLKKSPRLRDQIIGRGFFHSWLGCAADS